MTNLSSGISIFLGVNVGYKKKVMVVLFIWFYKHDSSGKKLQTQCCEFFVCLFLLLLFKIWPSHTAVQYSMIYFLRRLSSTKQGRGKASCGGGPEELCGRYRGHSRRYVQSQQQAARHAFCQWTFLFSKRPASISVVSLRLSILIRWTLVSLLKRSVDFAWV